MLWRSRDERFPAMGKCLERDLSRLLLYRQVNFRVANRPDLKLVTLMPGAMTPG